MEKLKERDSNATAENIADDSKTSVTVKSETEGEESSQGNLEKGKAKAPPETPGLLVTAELLKVIEDCRSKVEAIVKECRATNTKFRSVYPSEATPTQLC